MLNTMGGARVLLRMDSFAIHSADLYISEMRPVVGSASPIQSYKDR